MTIHINEPSDTISSKAISVWRISNVLKNSIALILLCILLYLSHTFSWYSWINIILYVMISFVILMALYDFFIHPVYLQRTWRYDISEHVVQLKYGFFHKHHIIIPVSRIEYVNTRQGPLLRRYHLSAMTIGTITSQHDIPALEETIARDLRYKIISLAQINDEQDELKNNHEPVNHEQDELKE